MWKSLRHPNVLTLNGAILSGNHELAMISDWMDNGDINKFVKAGAHNLNLIPLLQGVAEGLDYIHNQDLVHGDLKGGNILIDQFGNARLADFGMATNIYDPENHLSSSSDDKGGTVRWTSPELIDPERFGCEKMAKTKASDFYAYAMVIYEVISGHPPFQGHSNLAVSNMVVEGKRPERGTGFPDAIWDMLQFCWVDRPLDRPSVSDVLQCLGRVRYLHVSPTASPANEGGALYSGLFIFVSSFRNNSRSDYP